MAFFFSEICRNVLFVLLYTVFFFLGSFLIEIFLVAFSFLFFSAGVRNARGCVHSCGSA